jgi:hypothetical protein
MRYSKRKHGKSWETEGNQRKISERQEKHQKVRKNERKQRRARESS